MGLPKAVRGGMIPTLTNAESPAPADHLPPPGRGNRRRAQVQSDRKSAFATLRLTADQDHASRYLKMYTSHILFLLSTTPN